MNGLRIVWGIVSVAIYLAFIIMLVAYFDYKSKEEKRRFVRKNQERIQVSIASAPLKSDIKKEKQVTKKNKPKRKPPKKKLKKPTKPVIKEKKLVATKRKIIKEKNATKPKKRVKDLFATLETPKKPIIKVTDKPIESKPKRKLFEMKEKMPTASDRISDSLKKQKRKDKGVEDAYLARVQEMLEGWPAQSEFAGEKIKVHLKIKPSGFFTFTIKHKSANESFNQALSDYLKQLQTFGFGPHRGNRTYLFEAEFVAKE